MDGEVKVCKRGHPKTPDNVYKSGNCKECQKAYQKAYGQTEKRKVTLKAYQQTEKAMMVKKAYQKTDECKAYQREYTKARRKAKAEAEKTDQT